MKHFFLANIIFLSLVFHFSSIYLSYFYRTKIKCLMFSKKNCIFKVNFKRNFVLTGTLYTERNFNKNFYFYTQKNCSLLRKNLFKYFFPIKLRPRIINFRLLTKLSVGMKLIKITDATIGKRFWESQFLARAKKWIVGWVRLLKVSLDWPWHDNVRPSRPSFPPGANQRRLVQKRGFMAQEAVQKRRPWLGPALPQLLRGFQAALGTIFCRHAKCVP